MFELHSVYILVAVLCTIALKVRDLMPICAIFPFTLYLTQVLTLRGY